LDVQPAGASRWAVFFGVAVCSDARANPLVTLQRIRSQEMRFQDKKGLQPNQVLRHQLSKSQQAAQMGGGQRMLFGACPAQ
jgi:hypothetical protein